MHMRLSYFATSLLLAPAASAQTKTYASPGLSATSNGPSRRPSVSDDGRFVAFESFASNLVAGDTNNSVDIFVRDVQAGTTVRASVGAAGAQALDSSYHALISG